MRSTARWALVAALCVTGFACGEKKRTEIIVGLATDLTAPTPLTSVRMQVFRLPEMIPIGQQDFPISGDINEVYELPGTYAVYSEKGEADRVRVVLTATDDAGDVLVVRTAILTLVPQKTLFVRLGVVSACRGKTDCPAGDSCVEGRCAPEEIDSKRLPPYRAGMETVMECSSGTMFANTSTKKLLEISSSNDGGVPCSNGTCQEGTCLAATEGAFALTNGPMTESRSASYQVGAGLITLDDGSVVMMGGLGANATPVLASSEVYDPKTGLFSVRGDMATARTYFGAAKLQDGRVLVVGGINETATALTTAEIYDPKGGTFSATKGPMAVGRVFPAAVTLTDGRVLVAGGINQIQSYSAGIVNYFGALATAEIYDPATGLFTATTGPMNSGRGFPNIAALADGGALVSCGAIEGVPVRTIERFNATTGAFGAPPLATVPGVAGTCSTAPVADNRLLVFGDAGTWVFDGMTGIFRGTGVEPKPRGEFVAVMAGGDVLFAGGDGGQRAYVFRLATRDFAPVAGGLQVSRKGLAGALLPSGDVLIAGGDDDGTAEIFRRPGAKASAGSGSGDSGTQLATRSGDDYLDWGQVKAGTLPTPLTATSSKGLSATITNAVGSVLKEQQGNPWEGNFAANDHILCSGQVTATGAIVVTFASPVRAVGTQMGSDVVSSTPVPFKQHLKALDDGGATLGTFTVTGMMHDGADNSAVYIGASYPTAVIKAVEFSISEADNAFCMNRISIRR